MPETILRASAQASFGSMLLSTSKLNCLPTRKDQGLVVTVQDTLCGLVGGGGSTVSSLT